VNLNYYSFMTYVIIFRICFKDDRQNEVTFISMRYEFPFAVLWVVYSITGTDCGVNLFQNFKGNYFNFGENSF